MSASEYPSPPSLIAAVTELRDRAMAASTLAGLGFSIANDPYPLLRFRQGLLLVPVASSPSVMCVSGLATPQEQTPYLNWLKQATRWLNQEFEDITPRVLIRDQLTPPDVIVEGWAQWWPSVLWCVPLHDQGGERLALAVFLLDQPPPQAVREQMPGLASTWAYCWQALTPRRKGWRLPRKRLAWLVVVIVAAAMFVPIRQSALAPAQVISRDAIVVTSPLDGVVAEMLVRPNQAVTAGTPLLRLDTTSLKSQAAVLQQRLGVAEAELDAAGSLAFDDRTSLAEMTRLRGQRDQRRAELEAVEAELARTLVRAPRDGIAVYRDIDDWQGRPVTIGERILRLADPAQPEMEIQLAVADAIALDPGADVTLFLTAYPLAPIHGVIEETSYQARPDDNGIAAYRLLASIDDEPEHARLGLHGTAKVYGDDVTLGYYLLRRPLSALRAWTGW
ncbi:HlyD family efflux transporter periplasmic adaptor subunit [Salinicola sp. CPA57]|uniref:efflux RND transporter periplasmic adaptor subunit n=1 Tax=Salinicola sp. CPA57 TaxID=1949080 RepID=UPI000DA1CF9B|nr:HlyD family efflux transporter periplasmic adaptor subunit [Salinicola sp. CPA57]